MTETGEIGRVGAIAQLAVIMECRKELEHVIALHLSIVVKRALELINRTGFVVVIIVQASNYEYSANILKETYTMYGVFSNNFMQGRFSNIC